MKCRESGMPDEPVALLREARRNLHGGGTISVRHWRSGIATPRGSSLNIRPSPEQCREWMAAAGFQNIQLIDLQPGCPYHFGLIAQR